MPIYFHKKDVETVRMRPLGSKMLHQVNASKYDNERKKNIWKCKERTIKNNKMWKCLHGINMVKDHSITYQRDRGQRYIAIKERLPSAGVNIYRYISASFVNLDQ